MKQRTLLSDRLYFGLDPMRLRASAHRALSRVVGLPPERARISATQPAAGLRGRHDAGRRRWSRNRRRRAARAAERAVTTATAVTSRVLRAGGRTHRRAAAARARASSCSPRPARSPSASTTRPSSNPLSDRGVRRVRRLHEPVAPAGPAHHSASSSNCARRRCRTRFGRMQSKAEGAEAIRAAFRELSSFVRVRLVTDRAHAAAAVQPGVRRGRRALGAAVIARLRRASLPRARRRSAAPPPPRGNQRQPASEHHGEQRDRDQQRDADALDEVGFGDRDDRRVRRGIGMRDRHGAGRSRRRARADSRCATIAAATARRSAGSGSAGREVAVRASPTATPRAPSPSPRSRRSSRSRAARS